MSTVVKNDSGPILPPAAKKPGADKQRRVDRRTTAVVVAVMLLLLALIAWLAGSGPPIDYNELEYWQLMP